jgi:transposase
MRSAPPTIIDSESGDTSIPVGYVTMIEAGVPRVDCLKHGIRQADVHPAEPGGRFTSLFEAMTILWLKVATIKDISE